MGAAGRADGNSHPVGSVVKVNGFTSSIDLRQRTGRGFSDEVHGPHSLAHLQGTGKTNHVMHGITHLFL